MAYQVLARKWRPQDFTGVVHQDHISKTLSSSIRNGRVSHAYLFAGPRGVGKTTMARILAKALNCLSAPGPTDAPCGTCENCVEIRDGSSFDVIEIDGASNRGIENVRELRENVNFAPLKSRFKVYIIDEVHMLTRESFNALLKTLEEPPAHVVFVFATTEIHQIPETILSRCQKYFFKKISVDATVKHLRHIVDRERYAVSDSALYLIARSSEGSMRDAQYLLDQIVSFADGEVGEADVLSILGIVPFESYLALIGRIRALDVPGVIAEADRVFSIGVDARRYAAGFADMFRIIRLVRNDVAVQELIGLSNEELAGVREVAGAFHDEELGVLFHVADELVRELRYAASERVSIEMALLDMVAALRRPSLASIIQKLESGGGGGPSSSSPGRTVLPEAKPSPPRSESASKTAPGNVPIAPSGEQPAPTQQDTPVPEDAGVDGKKLKAQILQDLLAENKKFLYEKVRSARIEVRGRSLALLYPQDSGESYYRRMLDANDLAHISELAGKRTGATVSVSVGDDAAVPPPADELVPDEALPDDAEMVRAPEVDEMDELNPMVEKIKDMFHGQIVESKLKKEKNNAQRPR